LDFVFGEEWNSFYISFVYRLFWNSKYQWIKNQRAVWIHSLKKKSQSFILAEIMYMKDQLNITTIIRTRKDRFGKVNISFIYLKSLNNI
jgi:hypothetical protein